ncbi:MAG TPA: HAD family hydrolase [Peptococcaceae bacterium]|jgi:phosphoglycolate phosphatase|nr:HAD family hydrolase [Clostridia bacterium]HOB82577.1 HAD family hydrolase [Peptococcaceae bacterium]HPZ72022.1 HAD family hydrolase [Peptococcaceae bacterium]HQD54664.1 HAD family hydrolase [Peptococcaceae bacterium]
MKYQAVIFDLDGTLLNSLEDLADSTNAVLARRGHPCHASEKYNYFVGDGMMNLLRRALPADCQDNDYIEQCVLEMKEEYGKRWCEKTRPYPGVMELLPKLREKGLKLAVLSNKPHEFTQVVVEKYFPGQFDLAFGERLGVPRKPDPQGALDIAKSLQVSPAEILYLGDTNTDMRTAVGAGMFPVGVLWGFRPAEEILEAGARVLIKHPLELLELEGLQ